MQSTPSRMRRAGAPSKVLLSLAFAAVVIVLMLWLQGTFHRKVAAASAAQRHATAGRPAAGVAHAAARVVLKPVIETAVGSIEPVREANIASKLLANVVEVHVHAGQQVKKDQVLIRLDDRDLKARLAQARAAVEAAQARLERAQIEYDRVNRLFEEGNATQIEFDRAETDLKAARAELQRARQAVREAETLLSYATIKAPMDGRVIDKFVDVGDTVRPGQLLLTMFDPTQMQLIARVRESLAQRLKVGDKIGVKIDALKIGCEGTIGEIVPRAEAASRAFDVKVVGPCPPGVYPGMFGRILIPLDPQEVLLIPAAAVRRIGQLDIVDVVVDGRLHRRAVQLGRRYGDAVEVLSGLRPGERVALPAEARQAEDHD